MGRVEKADLLVQNTEVFNSYLKQFQRADVYVLNGKIYFIDRKKTGCSTKSRPAEQKEAKEECGQGQTGIGRQQGGAADDKQICLHAKRVIDGTGYRMIPGFIDIHMHIESSMMTPGVFGARAAACGVTTLVSEPHEIANVMGMQGIYEMINAARDSAVDIYYGIPSSVPSTNERLETTGGKIGFDEMRHLMQEDGVVCVGEVMNYRQIVRGDKLEITKFLDYLEEEDPQAVVEGHCPSLMGLDLQKFLYRGIDGDHTEHTLSELAERFENGMFVELQGKMLKDEVFAYIKANHLYEHCCFVTDDTMADELAEHGQLNYVARRAAAMGFPLEEVIYCASYTPARRMNLRDRGAIAPGKKADFQLLKAGECREFWPDYVFKDGKQIYDKGEEKNAGKSYMTGKPYAFLPEFYRSVHLKRITPEEMTPAAGLADGEALVRVIQVQDGRTQTKEVHVKMKVRDGKLMWQESGCVLAVVFERHGKNGNAGYGFVTGDAIRRGAAATTYYHDHHNLMVIGADPQDMIVAARRIQELNGGICTVEKGTVTAELPLPVAGILSEEPADVIGHMLGQVRKELIRLGYRHYNPIMSLCTLGLPVSPALKITDCGLVDVKSGEIVTLLV